MKYDDSKDFHHHTVRQMVAWLEAKWASRHWQGLRRVEIIHGKGEALPGALRQWCDEKGIPWAPAPGNPGATILHPSLQARQTERLAHKPLARQLANRRSEVRGQQLARAETTSPNPPTRPEVDLLDLEMDRLTREEGRTLMRRKHARD